eukprot:TRINITY_DN3068_c0_g1_i1.p1 TRINITY_DN3068_c0_g1~~TRINITY_DN3068_c0_g1_i1.p1  ORF type:complete len:760 (+),score=231.17 TRINITY_DN3068_c0_g1_i1:61-2280(+)
MAADALSSTWPRLRLADESAGKGNAASSSARPRPAAPSKRADPQDGTQVVVSPVSKKGQAFTKEELQQNLRKPPGRPEAFALFRSFRQHGRKARAWTSDDLRLISDHVMPALAKPPLVYADVDRSLAQLERLMRSLPPDAGEEGAPASLRSPQAAAAPSARPPVAIPSPTAPPLRCFSEPGEDPIMPPSPMAARRPRREAVAKPAEEKPPAEAAPPPPLPAAPPRRKTPALKDGCRRYPLPSPSGDLDVLYTSAQGNQVQFSLSQAGGLLIYTVEGKNRQPPRRLVYRRSTRRLEFPGTSNRATVLPREGLLANLAKLKRLAEMAAIEHDVPDFLDLTEEEAEAAQQAVGTERRRAASAGRRSSKPSAPSPPPAAKPAPKPAPAPKPPPKPRKKWECLTCATLNRLCQDCDTAGQTSPLCESPRRMSSPTLREQVPEGLLAEAEDGRPPPKAKFEVRAVPGMGMGVVATAPIERGELIIAEKPIMHSALWTDVDCCKPYQPGAPCCEHTEAHEAGIKEQFGALSDDMQKAVLDLAWVPDPTDPGKCTACSSFYTNALSGRMEDGTHAANLFLVCARINHSCKPNVCHSWQDPVERVYALNPVEPGEQLFMSYRPEAAGAHDAAARAVALEFPCGCGVCGLPHTHTHTHAAAAAVAKEKKGRGKRKEEQTKKSSSCGCLCVCARGGTWFSLPHPPPFSPPHSASKKGKNEKKRKITHARTHAHTTPCRPFRGRERERERD